MRVRSPGKNRKLAVFGAWCYGRGLFVHHTQQRKTAWGLRVLIHRLAQRAWRTGRKIILVMDQGNPHHAKVIQYDLQLVKERIEAFPLPHYSPELNLIEILWRHLKRSRMANVPFRSYREFRQQLEQRLLDFAHYPDLTIGVITPKAHRAIRENLMLAT